MSKNSLSDDAIDAAILDMINSNKSVAPRDIATTLVAEGNDWRKLLPTIRAGAIRLETAGQLTFLRKGKPASSQGLKGVYRLAKPVEGTVVEEAGAEAETQAPDAAPETE